ncbi:hypothetical protein [Aquimarina sp. I32.4]|uniref:hypothetical protein n=1 Tax=Aquimarina sp. I32.4 TaxID=2053903 RepID=UPI000CDEA424|nr:hypothetical protein [Aquimarina sp. I32.4]
MFFIVSYVFAQDNYDYTFLEKYPIKKVPLKEKTILDKNAPKQHITQKQKKALSFPKIDKDWEQLDCGVLYGIALTETYKTIVLYYYWGEELHTVLANYDKQYNLIDHEQLAYDEDAEGWSLSESTITRHRIHRMDALYTEPAQISYTNFVFSQKGEIIEEDVYNKREKPGSCIPYFDPQEIKYIQALNGLNLRDENGTKIGKLKYGSKVKINKYTPKKLTVNDNGKIINGNIVEICNYESGYNKKRYVFDGYLVKNKDLKLFDSQLYQSKIITNGTRNYSDKVFSITMSNKNTAGIPTKFITKNKKVQVINDTIRLPLANGKKKLLQTTKKYFEGAAFNYIGDINSLHYYLIAGEYFEEGDFFFVDKNNGEIKERFPGYPYIAPDKKTIVCFHFNPYSDESQFLIYNLDDHDNYVLKYTIEPKYWSQNLEKTKIIWTSNTSFIVNITPIATLWNDSGNYNN